MDEHMFSIHQQSQDHIILHDQLPLKVGLLSQSHHFHELSAAKYLQYVIALFLIYSTRFVI
jgi:hypothetical protein